MGLFYERLLAQTQLLANYLNPFNNIELTLKLMQEWNDIIALKKYTLNK